MGSRKPISYQWKIFIPLVTVMWIIILVFAILQYQTEKAYKEKNVNDELMFVNTCVIEAYESDDLALEPILKFIKSYYEAEFEGIRVSVYTRNGRLLHSIGQPIPISIDNNDIPPELADATVKGYGMKLRKSTIIPQHPYYFFSVSRSKDGAIYVHTAMPYTERLNASLKVDKSMWILILLMAVGGTAFAYFSTRYLGRNISLMQQFAQKAARGELLDVSQKFTHDELGDISRQIVNLYHERELATRRSEREHRIAIKATEEKIRMTREMSNNINHELKTPVGVIKGYLDTIASHPEMDEASRIRFISKAQEYMLRLCNMLNDLSSITRLEDGGQTVMKEKIDLADLLANIKTEVDDRHLVTKIDFTYSIPSPCYVIGNYNLLYNMFGNLLRNAEFHSQGTCCHLDMVTQNTKEYVFSFYDDGTGVAEEHLSHLFDRFYRIDKGRSRKMGGTGLGLPVVKNTVNVLGGSIRAQNRPPHGLEFVFTLVKYNDD